MGQRQSGAYSDSASSPDIDQQESQRQEEKAQGHIARVGVSAQLTQLAIRGLDAEAMAVALLGLLGRPIQMLVTLQISVRRGSITLSEPSHKRL